MSTRSEDRRHGLTSLYAALEIASGRVLGECSDRHTGADFLRFLKGINRRYRGHELHVVLDNSSTHSTPDVRAWLDDHPTIHFLFGVTATNIGAALCADWCMSNSAGRIGSILNTRPMVVVGTMSYSLYLWQQPFLNRAANTLFTSFPINIVLAGIFGLASYLLVERPALSLRRRLESRLAARPLPTRTVAPA